MRTPKDSSSPDSGGRHRSSRWLLLRLSLVLAGVMAMVAMDRLVYWLWYLPVYQDGGGMFIKDNDTAPKNFLRFMPDPLLGFRFHPNSRVKLELRSPLANRSFFYEIQTERHGFRTPEFTERKAPNTLRVVALGGSSTVGDGVPLSGTYLQRLGAILKPELPEWRVEVINAGGDGYESMHGVLVYLLTVRRLRPDLLVVAFDVNEAGEFYTVEEVKRWVYPPDPPEMRPATEAKDALIIYRDRDTLRTPLTRLTTVLFESGLFYTLSYAAIHLQQLFAKEPPPGFREPVKVANPDVPVRFPQPTPYCPNPHKIGAFMGFQSANFQNYRYNMHTLAKLAELDGVPVLFLSIPTFNSGPMDMTSPYPFSEVMARLARGRKDRSHVDAAKRFCEHRMGEMMLDNFHPTPLGHELLAQELSPHAFRLLRERIDGGIQPGPGKGAGALRDLKLEPL